MSSADTQTALAASRVASGSASFTAELGGWLDFDAEWSLAEEYPSIFGEASRARSLLLHDNGDFVAHAAHLDVLHETQTEDAAHTATKIRLVGSVAVAPAHRGRGLGRELMEIVVRDFEESDAEALVLWSDKQDFYARVGFTTWGRELWVQPEPIRPHHVVRPATDLDLDFIVAAHDSKSRRIARTRLDFEQAMAIPRTQFWVLERDGRPAAYTCIGKGLDFEGVAHDSGGDDEALAELLASVPIALAILPVERLNVARWLGEPMEQPIGLAIEKRSLDTSIEGLDSI